MRPAARCNVGKALELRSGAPLVAPAFCTERGGGLRGGMKWDLRQQVCVQMLDRRRFSHHFWSFFLVIFSPDICVSYK